MSKGSNSFIFTNTPFRPSGVGNAAMNGASFGDALLSGLTAGAIGGLAGGVLSAGLYGISDAFSTTTLSTDGTTAGVGDLFSPDFLSPPGAQLDAGSIVGSSGNYAREITTPLLGVDQIAGVGSATGTLLAVNCRVCIGGFGGGGADYYGGIGGSGTRPMPIPRGSNPGSGVRSIGGRVRSTTWRGVQKFSKTSSKLTRTVTRSSIKRLKRTILKLSRSKGVTRQQLNKLENAVKRAGGRVRYDLHSVKGNWGPHVQIEGFGTSIQSRHIRLLFKP